MKSGTKRTILTVLFAIWMSFSLEMQVYAEDQDMAVQILQELQEEAAPESEEVLEENASEQAVTEEADEEAATEQVVTGKAEEEAATEPVDTEEAEEEAATEPVVTEEADEEAADAEPVVTEEADEAAVEETDVSDVVLDESEVRDAAVGAAEETATTEAIKKESVSATAAEVHNLAFASDLHGQSGTLENAMEGFPEDTEYVSIIGDLVGSRGGDAPVYYADDVYERIQGIFESIKKDQVSLIWADHDKGAINQDNLVKCEGGYESGQIYEGKNKDGSTAYYIYGIGFYHMKDGGTVSQTAAEAFKQWVRDKDVTIPTLVLCHMPIQAKRGDNLGAAYWNEALNFAATGVEGITTDEDTAEVIRNIIYLYGHNHTVDQTEYVYRAGTTMLVQIDAGSESAQQETSENSGSGRHHRPEAKGLLSNIFYNALIPGYLKTSGNASLLTISDDTITVTKYNGGEEVSLGTDGASGEILPSSLDIKRILWGDPEYTWAADLTSVTAFREGVNTTALHQSETVVTISTVTREASCDKDGEITYIAVFENPAFSEQIRTKVIPAVGHKWGKWTVTREATASEDGVMTRICLNDASHIETKIIPATGEKKENQDVDHNVRPEEPNDRNTVITASNSDTDQKPVPTGDDASAALWIYLMLAAGIGLTLTKLSGNRRSDAQK